VATKAHETDEESLQREWWLRTLAVFQSPRPVFAALRDTSAEAADARAEPLTAVVFLAGIASVLATSTASHLLDDSTYDGLLVAVWAIVAGGIYAVAAYWLGGGILSVGLDLLGSRGDYRRARHVLGLSLAPLALSLLVLWPIWIAIYGGEAFRTGGADSGTPDRVFRGLELGFAVWAAVLLFTGVRAVHGWSYGRSLAACAVVVALLVVPAASLAVL
jgi:hypothetical protein